MLHHHWCPGNQRREQYSSTAPLGDRPSDIYSAVVVVMQNHPIRAHESSPHAEPTNQGASIVTSSRTNQSGRINRHLTQNHPIRAHRSSPHAEPTNQGASIVTSSRTNQSGRINRHLTQNHPIRAHRSSPHAEPTNQGASIITSRSSQVPPSLGAGEATRSVFIIGPETPPRGSKLSTKSSSFQTLSSLERCPA